MESICDNCSAEIPADETNGCQCGGTFCNDCANPDDHDCPERKAAPSPSDG